MPGKYIAHNISKSVATLDITNPETGHTYHVSIEPGLALELTQYSGTIEAAKANVGLHRFVRANILTVTER